MNKYWSLWFPAPKSLIRGYLVIISIIINVSVLKANSHRYFYEDIEQIKGLNFLLDLFTVSLVQILSFTVAHFLWGVILKLLYHKWYVTYRKGIFHLIEGLNAFLVTVLTFPFIIIIGFICGLFVPAFDNINWVAFIGFLMFVASGLISSYFYHAGYLFWSWLNRHNKSLNQKYYENQDLQSLKVKMHNEKLERMKNKPWRKNKDKNKSYR
jgi:hypothetical protein